MYGSNKRKTVIGLGMDKLLKTKGKYGLDFDDTITLEPVFFKKIIEQFKNDIDFHIVTYRSPNAYDDLLREFEELTGHKVIFTDTKAKIDFLDADIWIDDTALAVTHDWKSYGYKLAESLKGEVLKKVCKFNWDEESTRCHEIIVDNILTKGFKFCPYCGGELV